MNTVLIGFGLFLASASAMAQTTDHYVNGYTKENGTYVAPHMQTNPDTTKLNNYSTQGNTNPYTGKPGTVNPYSTPAPKPYNPN